MGLVIHSAWLSFGADASGGGQESGVDADASDFGKFQRLNQEKKVRDQTDAEVSNALHMLSHIMRAVPGFWAYANGPCVPPGHPVQEAERFEKERVEADIKKREQVEHQRVERERCACPAFPPPRSA